MNTLRATPAAGCRLGGSAGVERRARVACPQASQQSRRSLRVVSMAKGDGGMGGMNPFRDEKKEAARRALEAALSGTKDILADVERVQQSGGGGGAGGGSGSGGGGGWQFWKGKDDGGKSRKEALTTLQALGYVLLAVFVLTCWKPVLALIVNIIYYVFRIPRELPAELAGAAPATSAEEDVLSRLAQD